MRDSNPEYFKQYYLQQAQQKGGHLAAFHGGMVQRGHGLGAIFKGLYRWAIPHFHSGMKTVGQRALKEGMGVAQDILNGQTLGDSVRNRGRKAIGALTTQNTSQTQNGGGQKPIKRKRKQKPVSRAPAKKRKTSPGKKSNNQLNSYFDY